MPSLYKHTKETQNVMQGKNRKSPIPDEPERDFLQNILKENYFFLPSAASS